MSENNQGKAVLLLSGGVDSAALLLIKRDQIAAACWVDYGQPAAPAEKKAVLKIAEITRVRLFIRRVDFGLGQMGDGEGAQVVPVRNAMLAAIGANLANTLGASEVWLGAQYGDHDEYADCRPDYLKKLTGVTKPFGVTVRAPLLNWGYVREDTLALVTDTELDGKLWSCYFDGNEPCGECNSCIQDKELGR